MFLNMGNNSALVTWGVASHSSLRNRVFSNIHVGIGIFASER